MLRALKNELTQKEGLVYFQDAPFSGLVFDIGDERNAISVTFLDVSISCRPIVSIEGYRDGKRSDAVAPLDLERPYLHSAYFTTDEFPDYASNVDAELNGGSLFNGIIYDLDTGFGWHATIFSEGGQDLLLSWTMAGILKKVIGSAPVHEDFEWYPDGQWKRFYISPVHTIGVNLVIHFEPDGKISFLVLTRWHEALSYPGRRTAFRCFDSFEEILKFRPTKDFALIADEEFLNRLPEVIRSGFFDEVETLSWNGDMVDERIDYLIDELKNKSLKKIIFGKYKDNVADFSADLIKRKPEIEIVSLALNSRNMANQGNS